MKSIGTANSPPPVGAPVTQLPPLETGDQLTRVEFERRYEAMPNIKKAELIEGVVYMPSPVRFREHGKPHSHVIAWLGNFEARTQGVEVGDNATARLDLENEPQPDAMLIIAPEFGGRTTIKDGYVEGGPEFVAEISASTVSIDLNLKMKVYRRTGVQEYLVWRVLDQQIDWFRLEEGRYVSLPLVNLPDVGEVHQSVVFPGLWLDPAALLRGDLTRVLAILESGIASLEHTAFVASLQTQARKK